jgi:hemerythrin-like domain-containing protein
MKRCHPGSIRDAAARSVERPDPGRPERQNRKEAEVDPIELLMTEHRLIERALDAMDAWITTLSPESEADDKEELARFVSFIRGFADAYHHGKEEDILFVAMVDHGFPREVGPIPVMLREHDMGRSLVGVLDGLAKQPATWSEQDRETLARTVREFSALLRQHIQKEDQILYPMADTRLPQPVKEEMSRRFQAFEEQQSSSGEHQRLHTLADALIKAHTP